MGDGKRKPVICEFWQLAYALRKLHMWQKTDVDNLHDVWMKGAPGPESIVRNPAVFDVRGIQAGNIERRAVYPKQLAQWVEDVTKRRGIEVTPAQALELVRRMERVLSKARRRAF